MNIVLFYSSFRCDGSRGGEESPNISHLTADNVKTLCGRKGWETNEGTIEDQYGHSVDLYEPDCMRCARSLVKLRSKQVRNA